MPDQWTEAYPAQPNVGLARNRMKGHVKAVAVVNLVFAVLWLLFAVFLLFSLGLAAAITGAAAAPDWIPGFLAGLGFLLAVIPVLIGLLCLFAGLKLLNRRKSGKTLGIVTSVIALFEFPLGTAFGVYALWVLFQGETDQLLT